MLTKLFSRLGTVSSLPRGYFENLPPFIDKMKEIRYCIDGYVVDNIEHN